MSIARRIAEQASQKAKAMVSRGGGGSGVGGIGIGIAGVEELSKKLQALGNVALAKKIVRAASKEAAAPVLATAKALAPVKTGRLRRYIRIISARGKTRSGMRKVGAQVVTGTRKQMRISPKAKHYYPMAVEMGHGNVPARPYMRPALENNRQTSLAIFKRGIARRIMEAAKAA